MAGKRLSPEKKAQIIKDAKTGSSVRDIVKYHNVSDKLVYALLPGFFKHGIRSSLPLETIKAIQKDHKAGLSLRAISLKYDVSYNKAFYYTTKDVIKNYKDKEPAPIKPLLASTPGPIHESKITFPVKTQYRHSKLKNSKLKKSAIKAIQQDLKDGLDLYEIAEKYGVTSSTVSYWEKKVPLKKEPKVKIIKLNKVFDIISMACFIVIMLAALFAVATYYMKVR